MTFVKFDLLQTKTGSKKVEKLVDVHVPVPSDTSA